LLVLLVLTACSNDESAVGSTVPAPSAAAATSPTTIAAPAPAPAPTPVSSAALPSTIALPDPAALLQQSFDQLAAGYHFVITATVNGAVATTVTGDQIGDSSRQLITSQGKTVELIVLPEATWKSEDGNWEELAEQIPAVDPISTLRAPASVTVASNSPDRTVLVASYPATLLGLAGDQLVDVTFELVGSTLLALQYSSPDAAQTSRTEVGPLADTSPVTSPSA
jgi:hypothetical protein